MNKIHMDERILERIIIKSESLKEWAKQFSFKRYLYQKARSVSKQFYLGIAGIRGIGKTVMLLQLANETEKSVYFSADAVYLRPFSIYEIVDSLRKKGMEQIFIDEIHSKPDWDSDIKTIYDEHNVRVMFSGSSALELKKDSADLSRRAVILHINPISFREYVNLRKNTEVPVFSFKEILEKKRELSLKYAKLSEYVPEYLQYGGVMYTGEGFQEALANAIEKTITDDMAYLREIDVKYEDEVYRILYHIAASKPYEVSYSSISNKFGISKSLVIRIFDDLKKAGIVVLLYPCKMKRKNIKKEPKAFLSIPLRRFLAETAHIGSLMEDFFVANAFPECYLKTERGEKTADFACRSKIIEVGGVSKASSQAADYIAADGLAFDRNKVPLFLFGFLY